MRVSKQDILSPSEPTKAEVVEVEGLGSVEMRELSTEERLELAARRGDDDGERSGRESMRYTLDLVARALMEDGEPMFATEEERTACVDALMRRSMNVSQGLVSACLRINGIGEDAVKEEVGNLDVTPSSGTSSD